MFQNYSSVEMKGWWKEKKDKEMEIESELIE